MSRKLRELAPGGIYHLIQRGNNRNPIFYSDIDKQYLLNLLISLRGKLSFDLLYYVIMHNHYHFILQENSEPNSKNVSYIMQQVNSLYARYYNDTYSRTGAIFEGRFFSKVVKDFRYFKRLIAYIALNPIRAGMVTTPDAYTWSAHTDINLHKRYNINYKKLMLHFHEDERVALSMYNANLAIYQNIPRFSLQQSNFLESWTYEELLRILQSVVISQAVRKQILSARCTKKEKKKRNEFILEAYAAGHGIKEIARFLSISYETAREIVKNTD